MPSGTAVWRRLEALPCQTVLADGPTRRVVRYAAAGEGAEPPAVIAKFFRDDEGAWTAGNMQALHAAGERSASPVLRIPRVLGYDADRKVLLQEPVPGVRFDALLAGPEASNGLHLAGRALATLHGLEVAVGPARRLGNHIDELIRPHPASLAQALPALAPRVGRILDALLAAESRWRPRAGEVPVHRDVHARQLFLDGQRVWLIDWDLCARGDGALDVGNLIASLRVRWKADDEVVGALLRGYADAGDAGVLARVPLYEALTYVRLACKRFRLKQAGWHDELDALLARAERCVAEGV